MDEAVKAHLPADKSLIGIFNDRPSAEAAYVLLKDMGYTEDDINILLSDEARLRYFPAPRLEAEVVGISLHEGPGIGAAVGAGAGLIFGAMIGAAASLAFPGIGLVVAGPLAATLAGAGIGAMTGGLLGSLVGLGIPENQAKTYEEKIKAGAIIIGVTPYSGKDTQKIKDEWQKL